ncbi:MAG: DUF3440 domain-containing protein [Verrucomicrobiales bacterium]|nr:DUF3440 domain-containing protein [Verrucomicrobiales bacterium]
MKFLDIDVYQALQKRLELVFAEFDNIYVSFSGGKDSSALLYLCLQFMRERGVQRRLGLFHLDYEAQYTATTQFVESTYATLGLTVAPYWCCVPFKVTTCTSMSQAYWRPWDADKRGLWVRERPANCLTVDDFPFYDDGLWDYDFQQKFAPWQHAKVGARKTCVLIGIRAQESLNRWRTIASDRNINKYCGVPWTTKVTDNVYNAYPLYDWGVEDVWVANAKFNFPYNRIYDLFYQAGVPLNKQRVASPFISAGQDALKLYRAIDPDVWGRMVSRVNGVNCTAIYGGTKAMGWKHITKPRHFTWREYMEFLLGTLPPAAAANYRDKLETSIKFWRERGGVLSDAAVNDLRGVGAVFEVGGKTNYKTDKLPVRMEYLDDIDSAEFALIPTYKRMCVCILKNDHLCKYMGFTLTRQEQDKRRAALEKYQNL